MPDEFINENTENLEIKYRAEILKWLEEDHLWSELWQVKGEKNAVKRFYHELSPIKSAPTKIRAINNGLEEENQKKIKYSELINALVHINADGAMPFINENYLYEIGSEKVPDNAPDYNPDVTEIDNYMDLL